MVVGTAWLRTDNAAATPLPEISFGTRLPSLDYRTHGVIIPRDADAQAKRGAAVSLRNIRVGDLLFYATSGRVHHVSTYAGSGRMVHAPKTGSVVQTIPISTPAYSRELVAIRRFIR